jgi:hypothetical protein
MFLKSNHGFYMAELIISLTGWLLITGIFVPMFIQMKQQSVSLQQKSDALHVIYEYVQTIDREMEKENRSVIRGDTRFEISWTDIEVDGKKEVLITYENALGKTIRIYERIP